MFAVWAMVRPPWRRIGGANGTPPPPLPASTASSTAARPAARFARHVQCYGISAASKASRMNSPRP